MTSLRGSAREFIPAWRLPSTGTPAHLRPSPSVDTQTPECRFFAKGSCRNGTSCKFLHTDNAQRTAGLISKAPESTSVITSATANTEEGATNASDGDSVALYGALVSFGSGAEVLSVKLASDFSAVKLLGLPVDSTPESVQHMLSNLGLTVPTSQIRTRTLIKPPAGLVEITAEDPSFAETLTMRVAAAFGRDSGIQVQRSSVQAAMGMGSSRSTLSVSTVLCTWYKPSRNAWLHYSNPDNAKAAERRLNAGKLIKGRKVQCRYQAPAPHVFRNRDTIYSVQVSNLDPTTNDGTLRSELGNFNQPENIKWGSANYDLPNKKATETVKTLLEKVGPLDSFEATFTHPARGKAVARFRSDEDARKAVREISGTQVRQFGNSKIFLNLVVSTKFKVLSDIFKAIKGELEELSEQVGESGHVHFKFYNPSGPQQSQSQSHITIRIYGADVKSVAKAKGALENITAGRVAMDGKEVVWDKFFSLPGGLDYLKTLYQGREAFIYRDKRKYRLILYGSVEGKRLMQDALIVKVAELAQSTHIIPLDSEGLRVALHGGFRNILMALGRGNATLNITQSPKSITVRGSLQDLETATRVMTQTTGPSAAEKENFSNLGIEDITCAVCWTDATEPYRTPCGHIYCKECFVTQCSTASDRDIPIRCLGASANCLQVVGLAELKKTLPGNELDELLQTSFKDYIRKHTESFQYCPTPDCPQIYRPTKAGDVFTCRSCLTALCTTCHVVNHDGQSCAEYKDHSSGGNEAFEKWKKENNIKDCPKCHIAIQKSYGCNHMECGTCHVHFCWFCLASFDQGSEVYGHMTAKHGNWMETDDF